MTSIIKLTPLSGVMGETPLCYLLQVDEFRFLLDCGWNESFTMDAYIDNLKRHVNQIDAVLLSHPDLYHLGALPYMVGKCGLSCPIYATIPVYKMGQMFMYDLYQSRHNTEEFELFTLDDVDAAFEKIIQLKYSQTISLRGKGQGLTITPLPAGHMLGGAVWKIVKDEEEDIIYAVDYNHKKERHLNGCVLESISRPALLITDAYNATYAHPRRVKRDEQLITNILNTVRQNGNVLVAVDTAGRCLELCLLLDQLWRNPESGLGVYPLALLNNVGYNVIEFAKSQVEWMSDKIMRSFEDKRNNPFQFKYLQLCHSLAEVKKIAEPKVVLASVPDLECGFARDLFIEWCTQPKNSVVLTTRTSPGTLARLLATNPKTKSVKLEVRKRVKLEGHEKEEYLQKQREIEAAKKAEAERELMSGDSSDESDDDMDTTSSGPLTAAKPRHDLMIAPEGHHKKSSFFKHAKKAYPMFPFHEERLKWDDYGEIIKPEDFIIADLANAEDSKAQLDKESRMDMDGIYEDMSLVPTKCISQEVTLDLNCQVSYVDFEGKSDGESVRKLITMMKPKQMIIIHGIPEATKQLADYCLGPSALGPQVKIMTPRIGEIVDATTEKLIYQVKLRESLVSSLEFFKAKDAELSWVDGRINLTPEVTDLGVVGTSAEPATGTNSAADQPGQEGRPNPADAERGGQAFGSVVPTLEPLSLSEIPGHKQVFVNEPRMPALKQLLARNGIDAEFSGGVLVCNEVVAIKRVGAGRLILEGCLCNDYYRIRDMLYENYAIV